MKKILSLILVLSMVLMLFSCNKTQVAQNETTKAENVAGDTGTNAAEEDFSNYMPKIGVLTNILSPNEVGSKIKAETGKNPIPKIYYDDLTSAILALDREDVDYLLTNESTVKYIINQNPGKYLIGTLPNKAYEEYSMGALEKNKEIIDKINGAIKDLDESGELWNIKLKNMEITNESNKAKMPHFDNAPRYRVILTGDIPPMDYVNTSGEPVGFNVDLLTAIANKLKVNFEIVTSNAASRFLMLESGKADIAFWTLRISSLDDEATNREVLEVSVNNDNSKLKEFMNDIPEGIVTTIPYMIDKQAKIFLKGSKHERFLKLDKKDKISDVGKQVRVGEYTLILYGDFKEIALTDDDKKNGITAKYNRVDETLCEVFSYDNKEKLSLADFVNEKKKEHGGCVEDKTEEKGCKCLLNTYAINNDGKTQIVRNYYFAEDDKVLGYRIIDNTKEVQLGNSNYYMNIPDPYGELIPFDGSGFAKEVECGKYQSPKILTNPDIYIWRWDENKCNYNDMKLRRKSISNTCDITESDYNNLAKGGWTLDKYHDLLVKIYGDKIKDSVRATNKFGIDYNIDEIVMMQDGDEIDTARIFIMDNEKFIEIDLSQPQKYWRAMGEAIAQTIHKK